MKDRKRGWSKSLDSVAWLSLEGALLLVVGARAGSGLFVCDDETT
jgi:hypothetical protein